MNFKKLLISSCVLLSTLSIGWAEVRNNESRRAFDTKKPFHQQRVWTDNIYNIFEMYEKGMSESEIRERLDGLAIYLKTNPSFRAHIIAYGGRRSCRGEAQTRAHLAKEYLTEKKGIDAERIKIVNGGYREEWVVELWHGAEGATVPSPMLTIDPGKVKIIKNCRLSRNDHHS
jgi:hypothetical protein